MLLCATSSLAAEATSRFAIRGDRMIYDTTIPVDGEEVEIRGPDINIMRDQLRAHSDVKVLEIKSTGGGHYPSMDMAALVIDFGLDTHVEDFCESACVTVFLAGKNRTMALGGRLGFHQLSWSAASVSEYFDNN